MNVVPEGGSLLYHDLTMITDGHTTIEHSLPVARSSIRTSSDCGRTRRWRTRRRSSSASAACRESSSGTSATTCGSTDGCSRSRPRDVVDARSRRRIKAAGDNDFNHVAIAKHVKRLADAGVVDQHGRARPAARPRRALGDLDAGAGRHDADAGACRRPRSTRPAPSASIASSVRSNPASSLTSSSSTRTRSRTSATPTRSSMVMVNGRLYDAATLNEVASGTKKRGRLYWE